MLVRIVRRQSRAWEQTIGLGVDFDAAALQVSGEMGPAGLVWDTAAPAVGPLVDQTDRILAAVGLQPYQVLFLSETVSRLELARPNWWQRNAASFLGDRQVHDVARRGPEQVHHAVAVPFDAPELWQRLLAVPPGFGVGNVMFVADGFDVHAMLEALLERQGVDPHYFVVRGHFETTVAAVVPAGGLVLRVWAQDDAQVDIIGTTELIEGLSAAAAL